MKAEAENVHMWVHEEVVNGRNLTEVINSDHVNEKYLPGIKLPHNLEVRALKQPIIIAE